MVCAWCVHGVCMVCANSLKCADSCVTYVLREPFGHVKHVVCMCVCRVCVRVHR